MKCFFYSRHRKSRAYKSQSALCFTLASITSLPATNLIPESIRSAANRHSQTHPNACAFTCTKPLNKAVTALPLEQDLAAFQI